MNNTFGALKQPLIKKKSKKNKSVLSLLIFDETKGINPKKAFRLISCIIYIISDNYVCIDYLACQ